MSRTPSGVDDRRRDPAPALRRRADRDTRELTARCLASLARLGDHELVVVDDGSTDGTTEELCPRHPEAIWLRSDRPGGFTRAANQGLASASGDLLLLLNSDTEIVEGSVAAIVERFGSEPRLGAAGARLRNFDGSDQWSGGREPTLSWLFLLASGIGQAAGRLPAYRRLRPVSGSRRPARRLGTRHRAGDPPRSVARLRPVRTPPTASTPRISTLASRLRAADWSVTVLDELTVLHHLGATVEKSEQGLAGQRLDWLWTDLVGWADRHRSAAWARRARRALARGARLRAVALALEAMVTRGDRRAAVLAERAALARPAPRSTRQLPARSRRIRRRVEDPPYRDLAWELVRRELRVRYRRSLIGLAWSMLQPLLMMIVLHIAFSTLFRFKVDNYAVYALSGILFWNFFSQSIVHSMNALKGNAGLIQRLPVPKAVFPVSAIASGIVNLGLALVPLLALLVVTGHPLRPSLLFLPVSVLIAAVFTLGAGLLLAPLAVFFSDVVELVGVLLQLAMYLTPVFYPMSIVPERFLPMVRVQPAALDPRGLPRPDLLRQDPAALPSRGGLRARDPALRGRARGSSRGRPSGSTSTSRDAPTRADDPPRRRLALLPARPGSGRRRSRSTRSTGSRAPSPTSSSGPCATSRRPSSRAR